MEVKIHVIFFQNALLTSATVMILISVLIIGDAFISHKPNMLPLTTENCSLEAAALNGTHLALNDTLFREIQLPAGENVNSSFDVFSGKNDPEL